MGSIRCTDDPGPLAGTGADTDPGKSTKCPDGRTKHDASKPGSGNVAARLTCFYCSDIPAKQNAEPLHCYTSAAILMHEGGRQNQKGCYKDPVKKGDAGEKKDGVWISY